MGDPEKPEEELRKAQIPKGGGTKYTVRLLRCRRTGQTFTVSEHLRCPYCTADRKTIEASGRYEDFCSFDPEKDPINFGFDPDSSRFRSG